MKRFCISLMAIVSFVITTNAQKAGFNQNFESIEKGKDITKLQKGKFTTWGKAIFTVSEEEGKGGTTRLASLEPRTSSYSRPVGQRISTARGQILNLAGVVPKRSPSMSRIAGGSQTTSSSLVGK